MSGQSMREALEGAFDESEEAEEVVEETEEAGGSTEDTEESVGVAAEPEAPKSDVEEDVVDKEEVKADEDVDDKPEVSEDTAESTVAPPASWKPGAREHWDKVPVEAQREIARREKHMDHMIRESADSRKHQTEFQELIHPFEPLIAAQNSTPMAAIKNLMTTAAGLTLGTPQQKAQVVSNIIAQYGVDINELDTILVGKGGQAAPNNELQSMLQQELAPIRQFMGDMNTQRQGYEANQAQVMTTEIDAFSNDPANEFFSDVREDMADLMEMAANRNEAMTIGEAYSRACRMDPAIFEITSKRNAATAAAERKKSIAGKRHAASSVHGTASGEGAKGADTLRGAIIEAMDDAS